MKLVRNHTILWSNVCRKNSNFSLFTYDTKIQSKNPQFCRENQKVQKFEFSRLSLQLKDHLDLSLPVKSTKLTEKWYIFW